MDEYSAQAFIQGYPAFMVIDEGNQLIKGCGSIRISFTDVKGKLYQDMMADFATLPLVVITAMGMLNTE